jgi:hypothetical protein
VNLACGNGYFVSPKERDSAFHFQLFLFIEPPRSPGTPRKTRGLFDFMRCNATETRECGGEALFIINQ